MTVLTHRALARNVREKILRNWPQAESDLFIEALLSNIDFQAQLDAMNTRMDDLEAQAAERDSAIAGLINDVEEIIILLGGPPLPQTPPWVPL